MMSYRRPCRFKLVADIFELNDWRGYFLGANTPRPGLLDLVREKHPDVVTLSLTVYFNLESLLQIAGILPAVAGGIPAARPKSQEHP
jgi:methanogenic corrinoid protein MtbC1